MKTSSGSMLSRYSFSFAVALVTISIGISAWLALVPYVQQPVADLADDIDWGYLNRGLNRIHGFGDTARWWTGTWCGDVPFWRPLTSYVFWGMRLLWPKEYMLPRQIVSILLHLAFVAVSYVFIQTITRRRWLALLTVWLFAGYRPLPLLYVSGLRSVGDMLFDPKNVPDPLSGIAVVAALVFLARGRWAAGLAMAMASVGFKETGFMTWPLALVLLVWLHRDRLHSGGLSFLRTSIRRNWPAITVWVTALLVLIAVHWLAVGFGYQMGTNRFWYWRMVTYLGGPLIATLLSLDRAAAVAAILAFLGLAFSRGRWLPVRLTALIAALGAGTLLDAWLTGMDWRVSAVRMLSFDCLLQVSLVCLIWLAVAWEARRDWQTVLLGLAMAFIAAAPTWFATQVLAHARYLSAFFMELTVAAAIVQAGVALRRTLPSRFAKV